MQLSKKPSEFRVTTVSRLPAPISPSFVKRALKAAKDAGLNVTGYSIGPDGTLRVETKGDEAAVIANPLIQRLHVTRP
jgi:hypothetical protein